MPAGRSLRLWEEWGLSNVAVHLTHHDQTGGRGQIGCFAGLQHLHRFHGSSFLSVLVLPAWPGASHPKLDARGRHAMGLPAVLALQAHPGG